MVRFLCFNAPIPCHRPKKVIEPSVEAMRKSMQDPSPFQPTKAPPKGTSFTTSLLKEKEIAQITDGTQEGTSSGSLDQGWKSDEVQTKMNIQTSRLLMRKSQSLGSGLCNEGNGACDIDTEDGIDQGFSSDSRDQNGLVSPGGSRDSRTCLASHHKKDVLSDSAQVSSDFLNKGSIFSIDDPEYSEKGPENSDILLSGEGANESGNHTPRSIRTLVKSCSLPSIGTSGGYSHRHMTTHSRSYDDLQVLRMTRKDISMHEPEIQIMCGQEGDDNMCKTGTNNIETCHDGGYDSYNYCASAKDWIMPQTDGIKSTKYQQGESSSELWEELPSKDFKIKRIEDWVNELQYCSPLEEPNGLLDTDDKVEKYSNDLSGSSAAKVDDKVTPGMEAAKRYISALGASATMAQLSNHGLVVIPLLSAFVSLRVLNLSGNSIVRITAGALPRGLHMLNLSKNNISTIEGLRELSRLRVLDLSYNRIFRIGHGLASCSALKELYLAGNKISEVEGLHRLLKLAVLDLRFNKISTAKCLGQLASNYNSLQAISLEGNPAQKNVGDEQLKKYLQGLLPNLVYFNRQPMKVSTLKDAADRSVRLGMSAHHDRGLRSDNKISRKGSHGLASSRLSSSTHGRKSQGVTSPKRSRGRRVHLPPTGGSKATTNHHNHYLDLNNKILSLKSELPMHRSRSAGTLGAA